MSFSANFKNIKAALEKPFYKRFGRGRETDRGTVDANWDNGYEATAADSTNQNTRRLKLIGTNSSNQVLVAGAVQRPVRIPITVNMPLTADVAAKVVFFAPFAMRLVSVEEVHKTANGAALTVTLTKELAGSRAAAGTGTALLASTINLNATAETTQSPAIATRWNVNEFAQGDRISLKIASGSASSIAGVQFTLMFEPGCHKTLAVFNSTIVDQYFFVANRPMTVEAVYWVHGTAGTSPTCQLEKCTGTTAAGSGTELLTNNSNAGFSGSATAYLMQTGTLTGTAANLDLVAGDRLAVDFAGTLGSLANAVMIVVLSGYDRLIDVSLVAQANGANIDQCVFIADRPYRLQAIRQAHGTAGSDGGAVSLQFEICRRTTAVGSGVNTLTNNSSAGFDMKGTANTIQLGTFEDAGVITLNDGDRLIADYAGTITSLVNTVATASLEAI